MSLKIQLTCLWRKRHLTIQVRVLSSRSVLKLNRNNDLGVIWVAEGILRDDLSTEEWIR